jgi:hypothetical protein
MYIHLINLTLTLALTDPTPVSERDHATSDVSEMAGDMTREYVNMREGDLVPPAANETARVSSLTQSCARLVDGDVVCEELARLEGPGPEIHIELGDAAIKLVAGDAHLCALLMSGAVVCWGENDLGQLGLGHTDAVMADDYTGARGLVDVGDRAVELVAKGDQTCIISEQGDARCWGDNTTGMFGYGELNVIGDDETPADIGVIPVNDEVLGIILYDDHSCLETRSGENPCAGKSWNGKILY